MKREVLVAGFRPDEKIMNDSSGRNDGIEITDGVDRAEASYASASRSFRFGYCARKRWNFAAGPVGFMKYKLPSATTAGENTAPLSFTTSGSRRGALHPVAVRSTRQRLPPIPGCATPL